MGFFSWKTSDTNESIPNTYSSRDTFPVKMIDDKGNYWEEHNYEGYGVFGGKDYYELLAEMNGEQGRDKGIDLEFGDEPIKRPKLTTLECTDDWEYLLDPEQCEAQGFFYE